MGLSGVFYTQVKGKMFLTRLVDIVNGTKQMGKLSLRERKGLGQGHPAEQWQRRELNKVSQGLVIVSSTKSCCPIR